jgi:hypothetical protein
MSTTLQCDRHRCLLCGRTGEQLVAPGDVPALFVLHEHLVADHGVPWEEILLAAPTPGAHGGDEQAEEWSLPPARAEALGLPSASHLRVWRDTSQTHNHFYFAAAFPTRDLCRQAEGKIIDACKRSEPSTSISGGEAGVAGLPLVVYIAHQPGLLPPLDLQRSIWSSIHCAGGMCIALPAVALDHLLRFLRREMLFIRSMNPGVRWAEVTYRPGAAIPTIDASNDAETGDHGS